MKDLSLTRRAFIRLGPSFAAASIAAKAMALEPQTLRASPGSASPSDVVRFAIIGTGVEGCDLLRATLSVPGIQCVAAADLYDTRHEAAKEALGGKDIDTTREYRRILDRKDVDAVIVATPDHWHHRLVVEAAEAGKDVYCEKPMSHAVKEGFAMIEAIQKNSRICQIGSQRVSSILYAKAKEIWDSGKLGMVDTIEAVCDRNTDSGAWVNPVPPDANERTIDWNAWLNGAPKRPFDPIRFIRWRCFKDYGAGLAGDLFVHLLSGIHFVTGTNQPPDRAFSSGGIYYYKDGRDFPDLLWTLYNYPNFQVVLRCNQNNQYEDQAVAFYGKKGTMLIHGSTLTFRPEASCHQRENYTIYCWPEKQREEYVESWNKAHPGPKPGEFKIHEDEEAYRAPAGYDETPDHLGNFFQAVRTRKPVVENESFGNHVALACHMANYSYFNKAVAVWNARGRQIESA